MSLINISEGASLALHSLVLVAKEPSSRKTVKQLAEKLNASQAHLAKVFQKLSKAGLVHSTRGPSGGVELNKSASEISFLQIYEIIEGKVSVNSCQFDKSDCNFRECIFDDKLYKISLDILNTLEHIKLSDFK